MNPLTNIRSRQKQREQEVINGVPESASYHSDYRSSAYIYAGQLSFNLTEGDLLAIFSQFGEIVDVNLVRDKNTLKSRGFAFLAYEDQRSSDLAVDNLNGITVDGRVIAVDHVKDYKRLVDNPDFVDTKTHQAEVAASAQTQQDQQISGRILSGAEAEAIEDELGTSGVPDPGSEAVRDGGPSAPTLADGVAGASGTSFAQMLREVEAKVGSDWRNRGKDGADAWTARPAEQTKSNRVAERLRADRQKHRTEGKSLHRHKQTEKKEKNKEKTAKHSHRHRSRSRSPRLYSSLLHEDRKRDGAHDELRHALRYDSSTRQGRRRNDHRD